MGKVLSSLVKRPTRNWNAENRAQKVLDQNQKNKPRIAPRHPSTRNPLQRFSQEHPEYLEAQTKKDDVLLSNLFGLVVNPERMGKIVSSKQLLPQTRDTGEDPEFGFLIPRNIPEGRCSILQALEFITSHNTDSEAHTADRVAIDYNLDKKTAEDILKHFHTLLIQIPNRVSSDFEKGVGTKFSLKLTNLLDSPVQKSSKPMNS